AQVYQATSSLAESSACIHACEIKWTLSVAKSNPGKVATDLSRSFGVRTRPRVAFPHCVHCVNINSPFQNDEEGGGLRDYFHRLAWRVSEVAQRKTPLYDEHVRLGAKMVPFSGWLMPVQYTSIVAEH